VWCGKLGNTFLSPEGVLSFVPLITSVVSLECKMAGTREHYGNYNVIVKKKNQKKFELIWEFSLMKGCSWLKDKMLY